MPGNKDRKSQEPTFNRDITKRQAAFHFAELMLSWHMRQISDLAIDYVLVPLVLLSAIASVVKALWFLAVALVS